MTYGIKRTTAYLLADAPIVILAERHGGAGVLTLDQPHFRTSAS